MPPTPRSQLEVIYRQLGRSSGFRGFTPAFLLIVAAVAAAATAVIGVATAEQPLRVVAAAWTGTGTAIAALAVLVPEVRSDSGIRREAANATAIQMAFPLATGLAVTVAIVARHPSGVVYLPAVWLALFGLGVAGLAGLMRERVECAAAFYLAAAAAAYFLEPARPSTFSLAVGMPFTVGHALTAALLRSKEEAR
ncbi:MAG: hypothetical protein ACOC6J_04355 [Spirochaetota bacterium]